MQDSLKKLEMFFDYDLQIKNLMLKMAMKEEDTYNQDSLIEYEDRFLKALEEIDYYLYRIASTYHPTSLSSLSSLINSIKEDFAKYSLRPSDLKQVYQSKISNMRTQFVHSVNEGFCGYYLYNGHGVLEPTSINELLHLLHAAVVNNENIYQSMPEIDLKNPETPVHLYGYATPIALELAKNLITCSLLSDQIDIVNLQDRTLIMARDLGHALMVEIRYVNNKAMVNYFIPKVCNYLMINELPGITKITPESTYAKGQFEVDIPLMPQQLTKLLSKVPTDYDMSKYGGPCYEPSKTK